MQITKSENHIWQPWHQIFDAILLKIHDFFLAYGIASDVDIESEVIRGLGSLRFTIYTILRIANLRKYKVKLWYKKAFSNNQNQEESNEPEEEDIYSEAKKCVDNQRLSQRKTSLLNIRCGNMLVLWKSLTVFRYKGRILNVTAKQRELCFLICICSQC